MQVLSFVNKCALFLLCYEDYSYYLSLSLSLSLLNIARPNGTMGFRTETRTKNRRLCMYVRIYTYICRKITVSYRLLPQAQNLSSQRRCEWYDEPDLKSSSSLKNGGVRLHLPPPIISPYESTR